MRALEALTLAMIALGAGSIASGAARAAAGSTVPASNASGRCAARVVDAPVDQADALEEQRVANRALFIQGHLDLAAWCTENELYLERDNLYRQVIAMEPDNLEARKGLRYARNSDGSWKEPAPRAAKNRNADALVLLPAKRGETMRPYCLALFEFLDRKPGDAVVQKLVIDEVSRLDADNPRLHQWFHDVEFDGRWVTPETASGKKRRAEIKASVAAARVGLPAVVPAVVANSPTRTPRTWKSAVETPSVRVLGNVSNAECQKIADACTAAGRAEQALFGCAVELADKYTVYVFVSQEEKDAFVANLSSFTVEGRAFMLSRLNVPLVGTDDMLISDTDPARRLDCAVRGAWARLFQRCFGVGEQPGWIADGLGLYLTREMCGTRSTWFILGTLGKDKDALRNKLAAPSSDWLAEALKLLQAEKPLHLEALVNLHLHTMRMEDMLCGYALSAFLIEGHADELPALLKRIGSGETTAVAVKGVGWSIDELESRLKRWLGEKR